jgi:ribose-phosphate pyrophosphokinase
MALTMDKHTLKIFALNRSHVFGQQLASSIGVSLGELEEREFEDGEHKVRPLENVRDTDAYVVHSLFGDNEQSVNDKLIRLLFFLATLKDAGAQRVTAVIPYLCYARKDRKTKPRDPLSGRYVASLLESAGADRVIALDVHNLSAFQNAFRCRTEHLEARNLFIEHLIPLIGEEEVVVVSPDTGGIKRAEQFRESLQEKLARPVASAFMEKKRSAGIVSGSAVVGDVQGRVAIIIDDLIASGGTIARTATACHQRGAARVLAAATHGPFAATADENLALPQLERLVITDSIPPFRLRSQATRAKLDILSVAPLFGNAIERVHSGGSIVDLLD